MFNYPCQNDSPRKLRRRKKELIGVEEVLISPRHLHKRKSSPWPVPLPDMPRLHKRRRKKAKKNKYGENRSLASLSNIPTRLAMMSEEDRKREEVHLKLQQTRQLKAEASKKKKQMKELADKAKKELIDSWKPYIGKLKEKNYTKLEIPTVNQVKRFLKKEKHVAKRQLVLLNKANYLTKMKEFCQ